MHFWNLTPFQLQELEALWARRRRKKSKNSFILDDSSDSENEGNGALSKCLKDDGDDEFDPLLEDEEEVHAVNGGQELLYIGSLKVTKTYTFLEIFSVDTIVTLTEIQSLERYPYWQLAVQIKIMTQSMNSLCLSKATNRDTR